MELTWPIVAAMLAAGLLHAGWNAIVKGSRDPALDNALLNVVAALVALPLLALTGLPAPAAWPWLAASLAIHVGYHLALTSAYRHGELGLTYPLMRGTAPLLVALASALGLGEPLSPLGWAGVLAVSAGVLALGLSARALQAPRAVGFALLNAVVIASYTLVDAQGARAAGNPWAYVLAFFALDGWAFAALVLARRGGAAARAHARERALHALAGAVASILSYGIALWAMTRAPVAAVAALRESSVLFAVLLGAWLLGEKLSPRRLAAAAVIVGGIAALRLG